MLTVFFLKNLGAVRPAPPTERERILRYQPVLHPITVISPVILGKGDHYCGTMSNQQTMKLLSVKTLPYGELVLHYEAVR